MRRRGVRRRGKGSAVQTALRRLGAGGAGAQAAPRMATPRVAAPGEAAPGGGGAVTV